MSKVAILQSRPSEARPLLIVLQVRTPRAMGELFAHSAARTTPYRSGAGTPVYLFAESNGNVCRNNRDNMLGGMRGDLNLV